MNHQEKADDLQKKMDELKQKFKDLRTRESVEAAERNDRYEGEHRSLLAEQDDLIAEAQRNGVQLV